MSKFESLNLDLSQSTEIEHDEVPQSGKLTSQNSIEELESSATSEDFNRRAKILYLLDVLEDLETHLSELYASFLNFNYMLTYLSFAVANAKKVEGSVDKLLAFDAQKGNKGSSEEFDFDFLDFESESESEPVSDESSSSSSSEALFSVSEEILKESFKSNRSI